MAAPCSAVWLYCNFTSPLLIFSLVSVIVPATQGYCKIRWDNTCKLLRINPGTYVRVQTHVISHDLYQHYRHCSRWALTLSPVSFVMNNATGKILPVSLPLEYFSEMLAEESGGWRERGWGVPPLVQPHVPGICILWDHSSHREAPLYAVPLGGLKSL